MPTDDFRLGANGLKLDAPAVGDVVTVKLRAAVREVVISGASPGERLTIRDQAGVESRDPAAEFERSIWRCIAVNSGHAIVEYTSGYAKGRRHVLPIATYEWYEASELLAALEGEPK